MAKREFIDNEHDVSDRYYELATDEIESAQSKEDIKRIIKELEGLIEKDPAFLDSYNFAAELYRDELDKETAAERLEKRAFDIAIETITDKDGNWPDEMLWGWHENRHIMRALYRWALTLWRQGRADQSLEIFRSLLHSNPGDNIGTRYAILALRLGLKPDYNKQWELEFGIDGAKEDEWWDANYKKFPDEFDWWEEKLIEQGIIE